MRMWKFEEEENEKSYNNNESTDEPPKERITVDLENKWNNFDMVQIEQCPLQKLNINQNVAILISNEENSFKSRSHLDCWWWKQKLVKVMAKKWVFALTIVKKQDLLP